MRKDIESICKNYTEIENYDKAIASKGNEYVCHHRLESDYTVAELKSLGCYYDVQPCELIFLTQSEHKNTFHKDSYCSESIRKKRTKVRTDSPKSKFGELYFTHFGYSETHNKKQYLAEYMWFKRHGKCRWE